MRLQTIELYTFEELSEEAKERVRSEWRDDHNDNDRSDADLDAWLVICNYEYFEDGDLFG